MELFCIRFGWLVMENKNHKKLSKFLSLVLRHRPEKIGIQLTEAGWTDVNILLEKLNGTRNQIDFSVLDEIVRSSDKQRFAFNEDKSQIRANQGHSIKVDLGLAPKHHQLFCFTVLQRNILIAF